MREGGKKSIKSDPADANITKVTDSLKEILIECERVSLELAGQISQAKYLIDAIDERMKRTDNFIQKPETLGFSSAERYKLVSKLAEEGLNAEEIAKRSGISDGEVELIVNLSSRGGK